MLKQYFNDGLLQIAILLSLLRTDLLNFNTPNNELLNYPEVQDILQGQTLAYLPTNFHNHLNTLNNIPGYSHSKHADSDFHFSSLFRELQRFRRGVPTNIEAFLVSGDGSPVVLQPSPPPSATQGASSAGGFLSSVPNSGESSNNNGSGSSAEENLDANHNAVALESVYNAVAQFCDNDPFPGCSLSKEVIFHLSGQGLQKIQGSGLYHQAIILADAF